MDHRRTGTAPLRTAPSQVKPHLSVPTDHLGMGATPPGATMPRPRGGEWLHDETTDEMRALRRAVVDILVCLLTLPERDELDLSEEPASAARAGFSATRSRLLTSVFPTMTAIGCGTCSQRRAYGWLAGTGPIACHPAFAS
jgi:hypothetical protein